MCGAVSAADTSQGGDSPPAMVTRDYRDTIKLQLNSQILNPAYKNSLLGSASGWNEYAARYADLFAFSATNPDSVSQNTWVWNRSGSQEGSWVLL